MWRCYFKAMTRKDLDQWAQRFSTDLGTGGGRAPFDRIVRHHHTEIQRLLDAHLTFPTLAAALARVGAVRANGRPYSSDQLYMAVRRAASSLEHRPERASAMKMKSGSQSAEVALPSLLTKNGDRPASADQRFMAAPAPLAGASVPKESAQRSNAASSNQETHRDLTDEDVRAALKRIRRPN